MRLEQRSAGRARSAPRRVINQAHRQRRTSGPVGPTIALGIGLLVVGFLPFAMLLAGWPAHHTTALAGLLASDGASPSADPPIPSGSAGRRVPTPPPSRIPASTPPPTPAPTANVYRWTGVGMFSPTVAADPARVYVPDEASGTVIVINPRTFKIVGRFRVGASPEHVTPDWGLRRLYVEAALGNRLTIIDPRTGGPIGSRTIPGPYNLYFSLDGRKAIVVLDSRLSGSAHQVYFYDRRTWRLLKALRIPWAGADHLDFTADGRYALLSTEYSGFLVKIDVARMAIVTAMYVGGLPIDVRLAPDGRRFYVANQALGGVSVIDAVHMRQVAFLRTGRGAHGLAISRDARRLYVTNRLAGTLSVIDFATGRVVATWRIGGTPDMIAVSPGGTQLWISNRYSGSVSVIDARTGRRIALIRTGGRPHGLAFFPEPGRWSLGHNGEFR